MSTRTWLKTFSEYIEASPTAYHAALNAAEMLRSAGFTSLDETKPWDDVVGAHFVVRGGAILAWRMPQRLTESSGLRILGVHTDSPALQIKPDFDFARSGHRLVDVEVYGGPLLNTWFDRELRVAGRIVDKQGKIYLLNTDPILRLSSLAPHLDRGRATEFKLDKQNDLLPLFSIADADEPLSEYLLDLAGVLPSEVAVADLFAVPSEKPAIYGSRDQFFASYRLDNLASTYPALLAMLEARPTEHVQVFAAFNHEEIGSATTEGASGSFLSDILTRLSFAMGLDTGEHLAWLQRATCVSADVTHGLNATKADHYDPRCYPSLGYGPAMKISAAGKYATDSASGPFWKRACDAAGVPSQNYVNNNNIPGGTTIGPLVATRMGISTVDVGLPIHSMHSAREMCATTDLISFNKAAKAYLVG